MYLAMLIPLVSLATGDMADSTLHIDQQNNQIETSADATLGGCQPVLSPDSPIGQLGGEVTPAGILYQYWYDVKHESLQLSDADVSVVDLPKHGTLTDLNYFTEFGPLFEYIPDKGFLGEDQATFIIDISGKKVKTIITFEVMLSDEGHCTNKGSIEVIKGLDSSGTEMDFSSILTWAKSLLNQGELNVLLEPLETGLVGKAKNGVIALDENAQRIGVTIGLQ